MCWKFKRGSKFILSKNEKVEHHTKIKTHKFIVFKILDWKWCQSLVCRLNSCFVDIVSPW